MLTISGLSKSYGTHRALSDVSFRVEEGEIFGFIGPNGAGKSTTMRVIMGVLDPTGGTLSWRGEPLTREVRRRFGYMPEERGLYQKMRVVDQVAYFGEVYGLDRAPALSAAEELLEQLGLHEHRDDEVQALSLGNQQRVQLAVALVHSPQLLVLDEPFSGLDPLGVESLAAILRERQEQGTPIIFSSHQLDLVERTITSVGLIRDGRMVGTGPVEDVRRQHSVPRVRLRVSGARSGWTGRIPGAVVAQEAHDTVLLDPRGVPEGALLAAAVNEGTVDHYATVEPSLSDIFQKVMA
jgi:ABC-2 type transport system ATP-binding protein